MGQIVELRRRRPYGAEGVTNGNRTSAATNNDQVIKKIINRCKEY
jgi:hypothetical protein